MRIHCVHEYMPRLFKVYLCTRVSPSSSAAALQHLCLACLAASMQAANTVVALTVLYCPLRITNAPARRHALRLTGARGADACGRPM